MLTHAYLDFEASSIGSHSFPVEVGWCSHDLLRGWSALIRPCADWDDWSGISQGMHGIERSHLAAKGLPADEVMARLNEDLAADGRVVSDNPEFEAVWLKVLADGAGVPPAFEVVETPLDALLVVAHQQAFVVDNEIPPLAIPMMMREVGLCHHRALDDAIVHALRMATVAIAQVAQTNEAGAEALRGELLRRARCLLQVHRRC